MDLIKIIQDLNTFQKFLLYLKKHRIGYMAKAKIVTVEHMLQKLRTFIWRYLKFKRDMKRMTKLLTNL